MGGPEVESFLTHLAAQRRLSPSSHRQALSALLFLYGKVLGHQLPWMQDIGRPVPKPRLPVVLSREEVQAIFAQMSGVHRLLAELLYGTGMRITEAISLRVKDVAFGHRAIYVREGKGRKDRIVMLPQSLVPALRVQLAECRQVWNADVSEGRAGVEMPHALERMYPRAGSSWGWFWVFPQGHHSTDPRSGVVRRHHLYDETFQRAFKRAVRNAGVIKPATPHTLRHYVPRRTMSRCACSTHGWSWSTTVHSPRTIKGSSGMRATCRPVDNGQLQHQVASSWPAPAPSTRGSRPSTSASSRSTRARATAQ